MLNYQQYVKILTRLKKANYNKSDKFAFFFRKLGRIGLICIFLVALPLLVNAQRPTNKSRSEIGILAGGTYYIGDLNQYGHFKNTKPALGLIYRFNIHSRLAFRINATYGSISADDKDSRYSQLRNRNLNFESDIIELGSGFEFNYWPFQIGHPRYKATAYFLTELGLVYFNPKTTYGGSEIELRDVGTEGQGTDLGTTRRYSKIALSVPVGLGFRFTLGKNMSLGIEYGIRKTFTDYLDDVGKGQYLDPAQLTLARGSTAADLNNQTLNNMQVGQRGNANTKDWYAFAGIGLTIRLGKPKKCFFEGAAY